ncbi:hypothetical protein [Mesorhizobium qingshengii]|uniref:hypothetical protein n=1 Tax=Mesorhizobium qingshengii TaxID=1165689 RepID=UPI00115FA192|nr:hypothetical protein [Mesorhizobium qingshengii]
MSQKTLADTLAARETMYVDCGHPMCCKSTELDIQALIDRLGADHGRISSGSSAARVARPRAEIVGRSSSR